MLLLDESLTRHFLPGDSDNLSGASSRIGAPPPLPSLPFPSPLLSCSSLTMALVTLQRSPTPSAASSASTTNSSAGEVSGNAGGLGLCVCEGEDAKNAPTGVCKTGWVAFAFDILQERVNLVSVIVRVSKCVRLCAANLIYCYNRELFVATVAGDL